MSSRSRAKAEEPPKIKKNPYLLVELGLHFSDLDAKDLITHQSKASKGKHYDEVLHPKLNQELQDVYKYKSVVPENSERFRVYQDFEKVFRTFCRDVNVFPEDVEAINPEIVDSAFRSSLAKTSAATNAYLDEHSTEWRQQIMLLIDGMVVFREKLQSYEPPLAPGVKSYEKIDRASKREKKKLKKNSTVSLLCKVQATMTEFV